LRPPSELKSEHYWTKVFITSLGQRQSTTFLDYRGSTPDLFGLLSFIIFIRVVFALLRQEAGTTLNPDCDKYVNS
jgi:hypothetical protein